MGQKINFLIDLKLIAGSSRITGTQCKNGKKRKRILFHPKDDKKIPDNLKSPCVKNTPMYKETGKDD